MNDTTTLCCELCETPMSCETPPGKAVRYFHCTGCGRWVASNYGEDLVRAHTARETRPQASAAAPAAYDLGRLKEHLTHWLHGLDERDPYYVLGVSPSADPDQVRARFKELALLHHPDRGGDAASMRRLIAAYDQIRSGKRLPHASSAVRVGVSAASAARAAPRRRG
ncbi:MAG: J domain-containing protein [Deltaproteobacteria bacterium]|nr:J domain-containing protein [Deltaproteobacteria bacterium]